MKKIGYFLFLILCFQSYSQEYIHGKIVQNGGPEPLAFASVVMGPYGTISDEKGNFALKRNEKETYFQVSYIGYKTQKVPVADFKNNSLVVMELSRQELAEVIVNNGAEEIIRQVIKRFESNYPNKTYAVIGTQREESRMGHLTNYFLEASMRAVIFSNLTKPKHQIEILDLKWIEKDSMRKGDYMIWAGTGKLIEYFDLVNVGKDIFDSTQFSQFRFIVEDSYWNQEACFKITCFRKKATKNVAESTFYVLKSSYAIPSFQYLLSDKKNETAEAMVSYRLHHQKWYLDAITTIQKNKADRSTIEVLFKTENLDTAAVFDIDYGRDVQKSDAMLLSKQLRFYKSHPITKSLQAIDSIPKLASKRLTLFLHRSMRFSLGIGRAAFLMPEHEFNETIQSNFLQLNKSFHANMYTDFPYQVFIGNSLEISGPWRMEFESSQNFNIGGNHVSNISIGTSFEIPFKKFARPRGIYIHVGWGKQVNLFRIGELDLNQDQMNLLRFKENKSNIDLAYSKSYGTLGMGGFIELNRKRKIGIEFRYNYLLGEQRFALLRDPASFFIFNKDYKILLPNAEKNNANPFQIILKIK